MRDASIAVTTHNAVAIGASLDLSGALMPADYLSYHTDLHPDRIALAFEHMRWSYAQLNRASDCFVTLLRELGIGATDRVAYFGKNNDLFFIVLSGAFRAGVVLVPINWRNTARETQYILDDCSAKLIVGDREFAGLLGEADQAARPFIIVDGPDRTTLRSRLAGAAPAVRQPIDPKAPSLQLYTSGTTGKPKGVITSQFALGAQRQAERASAAFDDWQGDEVLLSPLPSFHIGGMSWVMTAFARGQTVVVSADASPSAILDNCARHNVTRTFLVPSLVRAVLDEMDARSISLPTLRGIHYGAAPMDPHLLQRSLQTLGCRFVQYYGMTEATGSITLLQPADHDLSRPQLLGSVGRPQAGFAVEIRAPDGALCAVDQPGEIYCRGPGMMIGYWNLPDATSDAFVEGWYRSGDGGRIDAEGYLYLTDRIKDMIVSGGENVYPAEVEEVLRQHPSVADCAVFGLPNAKWGEGVTAAVELRSGHDSHAELLIDFARLSLAAYKIPRRIEFVTSLPRTTSGKVQRAAVRRQFLGTSG